MNFQDFLLKP